VFGMSFGEFAVLLLVAMVVLGPKELPRYLRKAGQFAGRARDWANDLRRKSGIDEVLRMEGIDKDIAEIRKLTRGELTGLMGTVRSVANGTSFADRALGPYAQAQPAAVAPPPTPLLPPHLTTVDPERESPIEGADSYGALPDTAVVDEPLAASPLADDPLYARGEEPRAGVVPDPARATVGLEARS
jgi:sec-independent protein translocase protein TatB